MTLLGLLFEGQVVYFDNALTTKTDVGNEYRKIIRMRRKAPFQVQAICHVFPCELKMVTGASSGGR